MTQRTQRALDAVTIGAIILWSGVILASIIMGAIK